MQKKSSLPTIIHEFRLQTAYGSSSCPGTPPRQAHGFSARGGPASGWRLKFMDAGSALDYEQVLERIF
jgi:hypothetical protein